MQGIVDDAGARGRRPHARTHRVWTPLARALAATGDPWTLTIALALAPGRMRLAQLHRCLPAISTPVIERHLQQLVALELVSRTRLEGLPPRVELELTDAGRELLPIAGGLARWGLRHMWSPPELHERVDVAAMLRLLPALLEHESLPPGSVEAIVEDTEPPFSRLYRVHAGRLQVDESVPDVFVDPRSTAQATPRSTGSSSILGDSDAWVAALGPAGDRTGLSIAGAARLPLRILAALAEGREYRLGLPQ